MMNRKQIDLESVENFLRAALPAISAGALAYLVIRGFRELSQHLETAAWYSVCIDDKLETLTEKLMKKTS